MRRVAAVWAVAFLLVACSIVQSAETTKPDAGRLTLDPFRRIERPKPVGPLNKFFRYVGNRFSDLADIVTVKLGFGTDKSLGFQIRLIRPLQIGAGMFEGWVLALDHGYLATMREVEVEGGISFVYAGWIARKNVRQSEEAKRRNLFFGDVGDKGELTFKDLLTSEHCYDDENQGWFTSTFQIQGPYLPRLEFSINWGEIPDFFLGILSIDRFRVPPAFHKQDGPKDKDGKSERIPAPSIFWHGQEEFENYE